MIRRPPRSTHCISSAASDVYKRQLRKRKRTSPRPHRIRRAARSGPAPRMRSRACYVSPPRPFRPSVSPTNRTHSPRDQTDPIHRTPLRASSFTGYQNNYYKVLGLDPRTCTAAQIKRAYYKLARVIHPDKCRHPRATEACLLYTSPSPRDKRQSRMPSSA